jgi:hypothetical protein
MDEGYQSWTKVNPVNRGRDLNDDLSSYRRGGVCGHGMSGQVVVLREEICLGGLQGPTAGASGDPARLVLAGAEVGKARNTDEAANPRGGKGPYLVDVNSGAQDYAMAPFGEIATVTKVRVLQRTLCRTAKRMAAIARAMNGLGKPDAGLCRVPDYAGFEARSALTARGSTRHSLERMLQAFEEVEQAVARTVTPEFDIAGRGFRRDFFARGMVGVELDFQ